MGIDGKPHDKSGKTALRHTAISGHTKITQLFLSCDFSDETIVDLNQIGKTPLEYAASGGHLETIKSLLQHRSGGFHAKSALGAAIRGGHSRAIVQFLDYGVEPDYNDLFAAIDSGIEESVRAFLEYSMDLDPPDSQHRAALQAAASAG